MDLAALEASIVNGEGGDLLDAALIELHHAHDSRTLCALHKLAARYWAGNPDQIAFHCTHAYVYALEAGLWDEVDALYAALAEEGRI